MKASEFVVESVKTASAEQVWNYVDGIHPDDQKGGGFLKGLIMRYPQYELKRIPLSSIHIPDQEYDDEEQEPKADPYNRVQTVDPEHAGEYSANFVDRRPIVIDAKGWIIDGNHRAWAAANLLNKSDIMAWVPVAQLNELGNAPSEYKPNRKRSRSLFHATVDGNWVDVFFDRSEFNDTLHITFAVNGDYNAPDQPTSASKSTVRILSTVLNIIKQKLPEYMAKARPPAVSFTSKQDNRTSLYRKYFVPVIQNILGAKWAHEEYPSMGMTVFHWKPVKKQGVTEAFDQPYAIQWTKQNGDWHATADLDDGSELIVLFMAQGDNNWMVEFERDENMEITGEGDAPRVFATVLTAMRQFIAKRKPAMLNFSAEKEDDPTGSRARLYDRMLQRYITGTGYDLTREDMLGGATYTLTKTQAVNEISDERLQSYLSRAGKQVDSRLDRMSQARERLSKGWEIYDHNDPTRIIDRFEANSPREAQQYYQNFIDNHNPGDENFEFYLRRSTGIMEIARIPQGDFGDKDTLEPMATMPKTKPLPGGSRFSYAVNQKNPEFMEIMIFDNNQLVAELDLFATLDPLNTWGIETVATDPDYRGQGLGKALYGIALNILKLTLEAGATQTKHGQAMWIMLNSIPGVEVKGYAMEPTEDYRQKRGDQIVDQNATWTRYTFPVEPGTRSMRSTRRGTGIYSSNRVSMIAKWTGQ